MSRDEHTQPAVWSDLKALRRFFWLPILTIVLGVLAALALGAFSSPPSEARFRTNVIVDALPPLFGPPVLPGPFDYAALAMSDGVIDDVSSTSGVPAETLRARLKAEPRVNSPEITFAVTGVNSMSIARAWEASFAGAVVAETAGIQQRLVESYRVQLAEARTQLEAADAAGRGNAGDPARAQELVAAEENYETAARLVQSYDVVTATMKAKSFTASAPHLYGGGVGSGPSRVGAGALIGLVVGVLGALGLASVQASRGARDQGPALPAPLRRAHDEAETIRR